MVACTARAVVVTQPKLARLFARASLDDVQCALLRALN